MVFTVPHEMLPLMLCNKKVLFSTFAFERSEEKVTKANE
jgi:hypothetical protein